MSEWSEYGFDELGFADQRRLYAGLRLAVAEREALSGSLDFSAAAEDISELPRPTNIKSYSRMLQKLIGRIENILNRYSRNPEVDGGRQTWTLRTLCDALGEDPEIFSARPRLIHSARVYDLLRRMIDMLRYVEIDPNTSHVTFLSRESGFFRTYDAAAAAWELAPWEPDSGNYFLYSQVVLETPRGDPLRYWIFTNSPGPAASLTGDRDLLMKIYVRLEALDSDRYTVFDSSALTGYGRKEGDLFLYRAYGIAAHTVWSGGVDDNLWQCPLNRTVYPGVGNSSLSGFQGRCLCVLDGSVSFEFLTD